MKKKMLYVIALALLLIPGIGGLANGLSTSEDGATVTNATSDDSESNLEADKAARNNRVEGYKKALKETLPAATKLRIAERCVAGQAILKVKSTNNRKSTTTRTAKYSEIVAKLENLSKKLAEDQVDVVKLNTDISDLKVKIVTFETSNVAFQQNLTDLTLIECKTDPDAFKAALEAARVSQKTLHTSAKDIRAFLTNTIKLTLQSLKTQNSTETN